MKNINRVIFILSLAGLIMGTYVLQSFLRASSIICLTGGGCEAVRKSAASWPFGIPVPAVGVAGYTFLAFLAFLRTFKLSIINYQLSTKLMLGMATFGICFVTWFTYTEIFIIHGICMWCAISAVNMYVIFSLLILSFRIKPKTDLPN
jgi:uncharacterized membrane protein